MSFLDDVEVTGGTNGVTDYHCTWAVLHTVSFNGGLILSPKEQKAMDELLMYISIQYDCKVCRNNFVSILKTFGPPKGNVRQDFAHWLWRAHNNANEHSYATHSPNLDGVWATTACIRLYVFVYSCVVCVWCGTYVCVRMCARACVRVCVCLDVHGTSACAFARHVRRSWPRNPTRRQSGSHQQKSCLR